MEKNIRTFIALDTPPEFKIQAEEIQQKLTETGARVKWEETYKLHITLKFLGDVDSARLAQIQSVLGEIASRHRHFWLKYDSLGCFPDRKNPRIIWIGCTPLSSGLEHLQEDIETECEKLGFERETRAFHPHVTIGRVKKSTRRPDSRTKDLIKEMENLTFESIETEVHSLLLMKSELHSSGSVYSILNNFSFTT